MKSLSVALVNRPGSIPGERNVGWWAYEVPEFEVTHYPTPKGTKLDRGEFAQHDLILWEDGKSVIEWTGTGPPLAYHVVDSTLSDEAYQHRLAMGVQSDLILVDWDRLERFECLKKPVRRFNYCVNDRLMRDYGEQKAVDVGFYCTMKADPKRQELDDWLRSWCRRYDYVYDSGTRIGEQYARAFNRTKITLNLNRTADTRNHRVFDVMACRSCLLTDPVPDVTGEPRDRRHYEVFGSYRELQGMLDTIFEFGTWQVTAERSYLMVHREHTWAVRAQQLRQTLEEVLNG